MDPLASPTTSRDKRKVANQVKLEGKPPPFPFSSNNDVGSSTSRKRLNRPTNIRRPKLIGKSVEGAAMHAITASRARASNKQRFRGTTAKGSGQPSKGPRNDGQSDSNRSSPSTKVSPTKSSGPQTVIDQQPKEKRDEALEAAKKKLELFRDTSRAPLMLTHIRHIDAVQRLASLWWPSQPKESIPPIPRSVGEFYLSQSPCAWTDVCGLLTIPARLVESFPVSLARTISIWNPSISLLQLTTQDPSDGVAAFLMGELRCTRSCKCVAVFKLSSSRAGAKGHQSAIIRSTGWVLTLPRHSGGDRSRHERHTATTSLSLVEKDSAALDKLTTDLHVSLLVENG